MNSFYIPPVKPDEIFHYGIPHRSGRYPWGSGDRPYQGEDVKILREQQNRAKQSQRTKELAEKNLKIGRERLENRKRVANIEADRLSQKIGWKNTEKAAQANKKMAEIKKTTDEILNNEERLRMLGDYTRKVRNTVVTASAIASVSSYGSSSVFLATLLGPSAVSILALPVIPAALVGTIGYKYYQHTKY